ncbi:MAG: hypothetical protein ACOYOF_21080 [Verrucomicrobiaceae bacterium]
MKKAIWPSLILFLALWAFLVVPRIPSYAKRGAERRLRQTHREAQATVKHLLHDLCRHGTPPTQKRLDRVFDGTTADLSVLPDQQYTVLTPVYVYQAKPGQRLVTAFPRKYLPKAMVTWREAFTTSAALSFLGDCNFIIRSGEMNGAPVWDPTAMEYQPAVEAPMLPRHG